MHGKYSDEYIQILKCFLDPKNHAMRKLEPAIDYDFTPDDQYYPQAPENEHCDSIYELFTAHDKNGKPLRVPT
jgi:hypothetical protein